MTACALLWGFIAAFQRHDCPPLKNLPTFSRSIPSRESMLYLLSDEYMEDDMVAVRISPPNNKNDEDGSPEVMLCVVRSDGSVAPLCQHEDDAETDLFLDPRSFAGGSLAIPFWEELTNDNIVGIYGEGYYGQRPIPSLGGGPGYGAAANEMWTVSEEALAQIASDGVEIPVIDVGIAHGEKSRSGAY